MVDSHLLLQLLPLLGAYVGLSRYGSLRSPDSLQDVDRPPSALLSKYDFILVGGGSAGESPECPLDIRYDFTANL